MFTSLGWLKTLLNGKWESSMRTLPCITSTFSLRRYQVNWKKKEARITFNYSAVEPGNLLIRLMPLTDNSKSVVYHPGNPDLKQMLFIVSVELSTFKKAGIREYRRADGTEQCDAGSAKAMQKPGRETSPITNGNWNVRAWKCQLVEAVRGHFSLRLIWTVIIAPCQYD